MRTVNSRIDLQNIHLNFWPNCRLYTLYLCIAYSNQAFIGIGEINECISITGKEDSRSASGTEAAGNQTHPMPKLCLCSHGDRCRAFRLPCQEYFRNRRSHNPAKGDPFAQAGQASHYRRGDPDECIGSLAGGYQMRP